MVKGTKRASPGAEDEKNPLQSVELSDEDAKKLQAVQREIARAELILGEFSPFVGRICQELTLLSRQSATHN
jgi:hypothetical protein